MEIAGLVVSVKNDGLDKTIEKLGTLDKQAQQNVISTEKLRQETARLVNTDQSLTQATQRLAVSEQRLQVEAQKVVTAQKQQEISQQRLIMQQQRLATEQDRLNRKVQEGSVAFRGLLNLVRGIGVIYAVTQISRTIDQFTSLQSRIESSTKSVEEYTEAWGGLVNISKETGASIEANVSIFQRLSFVRGEINATVDDMLKFTDTVSKLGIVSGASQDALKNGLTQLGQSLSSNVVRAEEFNSIMENIPGVGKAIADQFGITTGQLRNLVIEGEVLSKDVFRAILQASAEADSQFSKFPMTISRAFSTSTVKFAELIVEFDKLVHFSDLVVLSLTSIGVVSSDVADGIKRLTPIIQNYILDSFDTLSRKVNGLIDGIIDRLNGFSGFLNEKFSTSIPSIGGSASGQRDGILSSLPVDKAQTDMIESILYGKNPPSSNDNAAAKETDLQTKYKALAGQLSGSDAAKKQAENIKKVADNLKFQNDQMGRSIQEQEIYNELRAAGVSIDSQAGKNIAELVVKHQQLQEQQKFTTTLVNSMDNGFKTLWSNAITGAGSLKDGLRNVLSDLTNMFYDFVISNPLRNIFGQVMGAATGGGAGGGLLGGLAGGIGGLFGGANTGGGIFNTIGNIFSGAGGMFGPGFADGGSFRVGGIGGTDSQQVAFKASPDETVTITKPGQSMGGGVNNVYNIDARGAQMGVEQAIISALKTLDRSVEKRALNAVGAELARNPSYGRRN